MRLTVIIVSYNEKRYLSKAIESCLEQSFSDFEIIIGDDGSSDGSIHIIEQYHRVYGKKVRYFVMERDPKEKVIASCRVSNVIKRALQMAEGKYIICLSGDDYFNNRTVFAHHIRILEEGKQSIAATVTDFQYVWNDGERCVNRNRRRNTSIYWSGEYIHISCFMFRREVYDKCLLLDRFCDDTGLEYSIACYGDFKYIPVNGFSYRQRDNSITRKSDELELNIMELLLFQDTLNKGRFKRSSLSRFAKPLVYVYHNRERLDSEKYQKYFESSMQYNNDILKKLKVYDKSKISERVAIRLFIVRAVLWSKFFTGVRLAMNMVIK